MAKDPAFLFYYQDFMWGTRGFTHAERGLYIELMCEQADSKTGSMFCPLCGERVPIAAASYDRKKDHRDIAHPINDEFRRYISTEVLEAYSNAI